MARRIHPDQPEQIRYLRANITRAEKDMWYRLNRNQLSVHFRRQHPSGRYIVDFAAVRPLAVEIDGPTHVYSDGELQRENEALAGGSFDFGTRSVNDVEKVVEKIKSHLDR